MMWVAVGGAGKIEGFDWFLLALGVFADVATYAGSAYGKRDELMVDYA